MSKDGTERTTIRVEFRLTRSEVEDLIRYLKAKDDPFTDRDIQELFRSCCDYVLPGDEEKEG